MNPKTETLKYRIWAYASPRGWDVTLREIADALDEPMGRVRRTMAIARWSDRVRVMRSDRINFHHEGAHAPRDWIGGMAL